MVVKLYKNSRPDFAIVHKSYIFLSEGIALLSEGCYKENSSGNVTGNIPEKVSERPVRERHIESVYQFQS